MINYANERISIEETVNFSRYLINVTQMQFNSYARGV